MTTLTRSTDPATSREAAALMDGTGAATVHREACLAEVRRLPGQTAAEIAKAIGLERHEPSRRVCAVVGNRSMTWWPVEARP